MNILYISNLSGNLWAGPNNSVPAQIMAQSKIDNVFWYNVNKKVIPEWKDIYHNLIDYPNQRLDDLPEPFNNPDIAVIEEVYCHAFSKIISDLQCNNIPYIVIPRSTLTERAQKHKQLKKIIGNLLYFNNMLKQAVAIQYLTEQEYRESGDKWNKNHFIIPNGISIKDTYIERENDNKIILTYIGRIEIYQKGLDLLVEAISEVQDFLREHNCVINIYGPDREDTVKKLTDVVNTKGIEDLVLFHRAVFGKDKEKILINSDIFIMTSRFEGHPMGLIEALSYGLPCIVTPGTNMAKEIDKHDAGWVAQEKVRDVVEQIKRSIHEKRLWKIKRSNAKSLAREFSWERLALKSHEYFEVVRR